MLKKDTEYTKKAKENIDWFKFETRIRRVILELLEPTANRSRELEANLQNTSRTVNSLRRKQDEQDFAMEKLREKNLGQDDLVEKIGVIDQFARISETKCLNEIANMIQNMDILKEKLRIDKAENEEHVQTIKSHDESIAKLHENIVKIKADMSLQIREESTQLKNDLLDLKKFFEQQKEFVTQYTSTLEFLRTKAKE